MHFNICIRRAAFTCLVTMLAMSQLFADELSLRQAVDLAVNNNPTIAAGRLSSEAAKQSAKGARALTNPEILVAPSIIGEAGSDSALLFSQPLEINGSRRVRGEIAEHEATAAYFDAETTKRDIVLRVTQTYWDVAHAQELVKLNQDNIQYLESIRAAVQKQYDIGSAPGSQPIKMEVELARARQECAQSQLELLQSKAELNNLMNRRNDIDFTVSEPLAFSGVLLDQTPLIVAALTKRPEVSSAQAQFRAALSRTKAAKLRQVPDVALQARRETFDSDSDGGVAIAINLPILDWGSIKADKRRTATEAQSREKQSEAVKNDVSLDVKKAMQRVTTASCIVNEYQTGILDKSEQLAEMAKKGYEKGATSYLEVLEAQRTLRSTRNDYYSALAEHAKALAQLEWAVGCPIAMTINTEAKK